MNKKFQILLGLMVMFSLLLAACGPAEDDGDLGELGGTDVFGDVTEEPIGTPLPGTGAEETEVMETPLATETLEVTQETVEPTVEEEMEATPAATATTGSGLPGTGMAASVERLSMLLDAEVQDEAGEAVGTVDDMVLDLCVEEIKWVSIDGEAELFGDRTNPILVPFDALSWNSGAEAEEGFFQMSIDPASVTDAPDMSLDEVDFNDEAWASEWETFWSGQGMELDMDTEMGVCDFTAAGTGADMGDDTGTPAATDETDGEDTGTPAATDEAGGEDMGTPAAGTDAAGTPALATGMNVGVSDQGMVLASTLMGMSVEDTGGENIGEIEDILISTDGGTMTGTGDTQETAEPTDAAGDMQETGTPEAAATPTASEGDDETGSEATSTPAAGGDTGGMATGEAGVGEIRYLVIGAGGFLGIAENNIPVPASAVSYDAADNALVMNIAADQIESAPTVDLENLDDTAWQSEADTFWTDYELR